ncbi:MAG: sigma-70 family RNA polymerase sigma factor [Phycisphaerae bacterium]|nr:sigma-70 family RNA polymerase sigma factor [Phycisphaerae bacterium]
MRPIRDKNLSELLMQLRYTPEGKRHKQLKATEQLAGLVEPDKEYPWEFVHFKITGFQPQRSAEPRLLKGSDLLDDLRIFMTRLSTRAAPRVDAQQERVYSLRELADVLGVSGKTLDRWRRQGLAARRFVFQDGAKRLGVLQSALDRFMGAHPDRVARARAFARMGDSQRRQIVEMARTWPAQSGASRHQIISQIAARTGRARETVRTTLLKHEKAHPAEAITSPGSGALPAGEAQRLYELYRQGTPVRALMNQFRRSRSSIYRIVHQRRALAGLARRIRFVPSDEFADEQTRDAILQESIPVPAGPATQAAESPGVLSEQLLPEYLQVLKDTPALGSPTETKLFRKYNCLKWLASQLRSQINLSDPSSALLDRIESCLAEADAIERTIVGANLRLVVSIASRHSATGPQFAELVSKGNYALITAVQEFDYTKGLRFGRQAALSIAKEYAKASGRSTELSHERAVSVATIQQQLRRTADIGAIERARQSLTEVIQQELDEREQHIILHHFGLVGSGIRRQVKTLQQIGDDLGLTKERVRQIELIALQKLRQCLSAEQFELLTG